MAHLTPLADHGRTARAEAGLSPAAALNDALRRTFLGGQVMMTAGVASLEPLDRLACKHACNCDPLGGVFRVEC